MEENPENIKIINIDSYILNAKKKNVKKNTKIPNTPPCKNSATNSPDNSLLDPQSQSSTKVFHFGTTEDTGAKKAPGPDRRSENRVIVSSNKWIFNNSDFLFENQYENIVNIYNFYLSQKEKSSSIDIFFSNNSNKIEKLKIYIQEINKKISSYRSQDINKGKFNPDLFVDFNHILHLLFENKLECFYCKQKVLVIYPSVREPKQWSLERIDNSYGHNKNNIEIACLTCNLKRRTMYHQKYIFTKQISNIIKKE